MIFNNFIYFSSCAQGDIGAWGLIHVIGGEHHLILLGDWDFYHDYIYVDNYLISTNEIEEFISKAESIKS